MEDKNSFVLYTNYYEIIKDATDEDAGLLFKAILEYTATGKISELPNNLTLAFKFIKNQLDVDSNKYKKRVERQRANGLKGGAPKGNQNAKKNNNPNQPKSTQNKHNDNDNDNDNVNDNDNDNVNDNDNDNDLLLLKEKTKIFKVPSLDEIKNYCLERENNLDAEQFFDYYTSKGWMVGKNKMKDWKAAIRTWERKKNKEPAESNVIKGYNFGY